MQHKSFRAWKSSSSLSSRERLLVPARARTTQCVRNGCQKRRDRRKWLDTTNCLIYAACRLECPRATPSRNGGKQMPRTRSVRHLVVGFAIFVLFASIACAQSTISGQVRDSSGAIMAGVTVEAASPALIERSRTATTNGEGRYAIVDVRPGTYTMTFT